MGKPGPKFIVVFNLVMNLPMAIALSITAPLIMGEDVFTVHTLWMILIGFVLATIINLVVPIQKISKGFAGRFNLKEKTFLGEFVGNIPVCFIFTAVIGLIMTAINVPKFPIFIFAFLGTFLPIYIVCFIVSMIFAPLAFKAAMAADQKVISKEV